MKIAVIFDKLVEGTTGIYVIRALEELGHEVDHYWLRDAKRIQKQYELYFRVDHGYYELDLPQHLNPSVYWALDIHHSHSFKAVTQIHCNYNYLFGCHRSEVEELKLMGIKIEWLPVGCDPGIHARKDNPSTYDVVFVGGDDGIPRKYLLQELRERYPKSFIGQTPFDQMSEWYSSAKIGFNYSINNDINMRFFEIMSCGALLLTNDLPRKDFELLGLTPGRDFVEFKTYDELFSRVEYYLKHDQERKQIAENGRQKAIRDHTYRKRMEIVMRRVNQQSALGT